MNTLQPHQQRVVDEKADLDEKIVKLSDFILVNPLFNALPSPERGRMYRQHTAMRAYSAVLGERIEGFQS